MARHYGNNPAWLSRQTPLARQIIQDGIIYNIDADLSESYPGVGDNWYDIAPSGYSGTLRNSPEYINDGFGHIYFNADYMTIDRALLGEISNGTQVTFCAWFKGTQSQSLLRMQYTSAPYIVPLWSTSRRFIISTKGTSVGPFLGTAAEDDNWHYISCVYHKDTFWGIYLDTTLISTSTSHDVNLPTFDTVGTFATFSYIGVGEYLDGSISMAHIYNRALSSGEIASNFNITRGRFGV